MQRPVLPASPRSSSADVVKNAPRRGVVYVGHIPHGFYEMQMRDFFNQFGAVTRLRMSRSKKSGRSRGYAFVEFLHEDVAKVAAEAMNNYIMFRKLLKCVFMPPESVHPRTFDKANKKLKDPKHYKYRAVQIHNEPKSAKKQQKAGRAMVKHHQKALEKLAKLGITYSCPIVGDLGTTIAQKSDTGQSKGTQPSVICCSDKSAALIGTENVTSEAGSRKKRQKKLRDAPMEELDDSKPGGKRQRNDIRMSVTQDVSPLSSKASLTTSADETVHSEGSEGSVHPTKTPVDVQKPTERKAVTPRSMTESSGKKKLSTPSPRRLRSKGKKMKSPRNSSELPGNSASIESSKRLKESSDALVSEKSSADVVAQNSPADTITQKSPADVIAPKSPAAPESFGEISKSRSKEKKRPKEDTTKITADSVATLKVPGKPIAKKKSPGRKHISPRYTRSMMKKKTESSENVPREKSARKSPTIETKKMKTTGKAERRRTAVY